MHREREPERVAHLQKLHSFVTTKLAIDDAKQKLDVVVSHVVACSSLVLSRSRSCVAKLFGDVGGGNGRACLWHGQTARPTNYGQQQLGAVYATQGILLLVASTLASMVGVALP
jgi:hypothetical protein